MATAHSKRRHLTPVETNDEMTSDSTVEVIGPHPGGLDAGPDPRLSVSIPHAAQLIDISRAELYREISRQRLRTIRIGRRHLIAMEELRRYVRDLSREQYGDERSDRHGATRP